MNDDIKEIDSIIFGIFSPKEIIDMSVCKIDSTKLIGNGTVYDERMGSSLENNRNCVTCKMTSKQCPGHFGHIEFNECIIHPLFYKLVVSFLKCFCIQCNRLLITKDQISLCDLMKYKLDVRFKKLMEKLEKVDICCHCSHPQPKITYTTIDNTISMIYKDNISGEKDNKISIILSVDEIKKMFDEILDEDIILCGFVPSRIHPRNLIISVFPVLPPCARPFVVADGNICDDDLTNQILEIIKANNILKKDDIELPDPKRDTKRLKALQSLKFRVMTFYNNSTGKAKHPTNNRPIKGLKERLTGKEGQIRNNLMGKRVEFSGRTVIGPDPNLPFGWLGLPVEMATELTIPERVTSFNKKYLSDIVNNDKANFVITKNKNNEETRLNLKYSLYTKGTKLLYNDVVIRNGCEIHITNQNFTLKEGDQIKRNGKLLIKFDKDIHTDHINDYLSYPIKKHIELNIGDEVHRHLKDGDIVLLNRQPTLHKGSMLAKKVKVMKGKTIRMNLSTTKSFNADFDGDEMNIHVPQFLESRAELENLCATKYNIISAQASKPNIVIVQDSLLGAYEMTKNDVSMSQGNFFDISMAGTINGKSLWSLQKMNTIKKVLQKFGKKLNLYTGKSLFSLLLPEDLIYEKHNKSNPEEPYVKIYNGVMYEGTLDKLILGSSHNSLIQILNKEYGVEVTSEFISNIQFITNQWLVMSGFSIGLEDCLITNPENNIKINDILNKCYIEATGIEDTTHNAGIREVRVTATLNKAKDVGMRISKESMSKNNNLISTVKSGSKGDFFNIAQLTGLLGQQNLLGQRVKPCLNNSKRTLPHYPFEHISKELEYESRGFIRHSFIEGLNPQEFYFHSMSGREGICDTAMGTAKSGYIQRRIIKLCEDIQVKYDGSVRDVTGKIYQLVYGDNGFDPCMTVKCNGVQETCDISRITDRLNLQNELKLEDTRKQLITKICKKTGRNCNYSSWSLVNLEQRLESIDLELE